MKGFLLIVIVLFIFGCTKQGDSSNAGMGYYEFYRLINPNNLYYKCQGDLLLNYTKSTYAINYNFTTIYKEDTVKFFQSETGKFSDTFVILPSSTPQNSEGYYYSGKLSFLSDQNSAWTCTYQLSDTSGFVFSFISPTPHLITFLPVYNHQIITHIIDSVVPTIIKPWIEVVPIEPGICDTMQLFWR
jgi:hypothetical protein